MLFLRMLGISLKYVLILNLKNCTTILSSATQAKQTEQDVEPQVDFGLMSKEIIAWPMQNGPSMKYYTIRLACRIFFTKRRTVWKCSDLRDIPNLKCKPRI